MGWNKKIRRVVAKFGGIDLSDDKRIREAAVSVAYGIQRGVQMTAAVSAMGNVTDPSCLWANDIPTAGFLSTNQRVSFFVDSDMKDKVANLFKRMLKESYVKENFAKVRTFSTDSQQVFPKAGISSWEEIYG